MIFDIGIMATILGTRVSGATYYLLQEFVRDKGGVFAGGLSDAESGMLERRVWRRETHVNGQPPFFASFERGGKEGRVMDIFYPPPQRPLHSDGFLSGDAQSIKITLFAGSDGVI